MARVHFLRPAPNPHARPASASCARLRGVLGSASLRGSPRGAPAPVPGELRSGAHVPAARPTGKVSARGGDAPGGPGRPRSPPPPRPPRPRGRAASQSGRSCRRGAGGGAASPARADLLLPQGDHPLAAMASLLTTPSPGEELITTPILQATEARSPEAEASTALIAVVITVVFLTLLSVVILIFFYLYKNKGSYVTYEPAEGEPSAILQMESDSAKGREKEEYFI
nr:small cell adhesion glycoprotein [Equus asinus]